MKRRDFLGSMAAGTFGGLAWNLVPPDRPPKLGFDNFSVRACQWKAEELLDYADQLKVDTLMFSDLNVYRSQDDSYFKELKEDSDSKGIEIQVGTGSVCPSSAAFNDQHGPAEEHLALTVRIASLMGSPVARCYLGRSSDRKTPGGIQVHIQAMVRVLKSVRNLALDLGVKVAVENHSGDMQAWELMSLIEQAGPDFVGATLDSGNATWTLEDPLDNLKVLGPYAVTTGIRDSMLWETENGVAVQWTAMGEGIVDQTEYFGTFRRLCPQVPVVLEIISGFTREFAVWQEDFWKGYEKIPAANFARFLALAKRGKQIAAASFPEGPERRQVEARYQREELERSLDYCRRQLGLGRQA